MEIIDEHGELCAWCSDDPQDSRSTRIVGFQYQVVKVLQTAKMKILKKRSKMFG